MLLLALDTAGAQCAVALAHAGPDEACILARAAERIRRGHAERLMPMIETVLIEAQASFAELDRVVVTTGPGSFTGVRVGIAAARGLSLALGIPAFGVGSLNALAFPVVQSASAGTVAAVLDANRGEIFAFAENIASGDVLVEAAAMRPEELAAILGGTARPLILTGAGAPLVASLLDESAARVVGTSDCPAIADVVALARCANELRPPLPLYARGADARPQLDVAVARR
jgi:tRNA threonylcarbamoyl adenosine modification protein YeaZ